MEADFWLYENIPKSFIDCWSISVSNLEQCHTASTKSAVSLPYSTYNLEIRRLSETQAWGIQDTWRRTADGMDITQRALLITINFCAEPRSNMANSLQTKLEPIDSNREPRVLGQENTSKWLYEIGWNLAAGWLWYFDGHLILMAEQRGRKFEGGKEAEYWREYWCWLHEATRILVLLWMAQLARLTGVPPTWISRV